MMQLLRTAAPRRAQIAWTLGLGLLVVLPGCFSGGADADTDPYPNEEDPRMPAGEPFADVPVQGNCIGHPYDGIALQKTMEQDTAVVIPELTYRQIPEYPEEARESFARGLIFMDVLVKEDGKVARVCVTNRDANTLLVSPALTAAYVSKYKPATQNGTPVAMWTEMVVNFQLDDVGATGQRSGNP